MIPTWSHGYFPDALYTCGFYREMAPNWLDFSALVKGHRPTRQEGQPFRYLELGSGMGLHLCLLAAAYPEGQFVGVDFHVDQIAHSLQLQQQLGLANLRFLQADFLHLAEALAADKTPEGLEPRGFDYVVAHGVLTWVVPAVQQALLTITGRLLGIGGLFYCSYNTLPGWQSAEIVQHLAEKERSCSHPADALGAYRRTTQRLQRLLDLEDGRPSPLAVQHPGLRQVLEQINGAEAGYLLHEYANQGWKPIYVDSVHAMGLAHQLRFIGTATLPELFRDLLPPALQQAIGEDPSSSGQELLLDLATNKLFRRDLFVCGYRPLANRELQNTLGGFRLVRVNSLARDPIDFVTPFGTIRGDAAAYAALDDRLAQDSATLTELTSITGAGLHTTAMMAALSLHNGDLAFDRTACVDPSHAREANHELLRLIEAGAPYRFLAAPAWGTALPVTLPEAVLLAAQQRGVTPADAPAALVAALESLGQRLQAVNNVAPTHGEPGDPNRTADQQALAEQEVSRFRREELKRFLSAGATQSWRS